MMFWIFLVLQSLKSQWKKFTWARRSCTQISKCSVCATVLWVKWRRWRVISCRRCTTTLISMMGGWSTWRSWRVVRNWCSTSWRGRMEFTATGRSIWRETSSENTMSFLASSSSDHPIDHFQIWLIQSTVVGLNSNHQMKSKRPLLPQRSRSRKALSTTGNLQIPPKISKKSEKVSDFLGPKRKVSKIISKLEQNVCELKKCYQVPRKTSSRN